MALRDVLRGRRSGTTRRAVIGGFGPGLTGLLASACGGAGAGAGGSTTGTVATQLPPAKLTYLHSYARPDQVGFIDEHLKAFRETYPQIQIEQSPEGVGPKLIAAAAAGTPPDLVRSYPQDINDYAAKGILLDLAPRVKNSKEINLKDADLPQTAFDEMRLGQALYSIPDTQAAVMIFYNRDLLQKAGLPEPADTWTTADVLTMARQATNAAANLWGFNITRTGVRMMPWVWGNGGEYFDEKYTKALVDQPAVYETYQWAADFVAKYRYAPNADEIKQIPVVPGGAFASGVYALHVQNTGGFQDAQANWKHLNWSTVAWPKGSKGQSHLIDAIGSAVTSGSKFPDHAWRYSEFAGSKKGQDAWSRLWGNPMRLSSLKYQFGGTVTAQQQKSIEVALKTQKPRPRFDKAVDAQKLIDADLERVAQGQLTAKEALTAAAGKINALLKG
jgi:multiple sugar transport system substrate-binding protein